MDERVRGHVRQAFMESRLATRQWRLWHNRVAQLAAAAVLVLGVFIGLYAWDLVGTEAYAVSQTIEALRKIESSRAFCTDREGRKFEMWTRPDPVTGANDFICLMYPEQDCTVISTPHVSYYFYSTRNLVRIVRGQLITSDLNPAGMIESLMSEADRKGGSLDIRPETDARYGDAISVHYIGAEHEYKAWVDPKTRLLMGLDLVRTSMPGEFVRSIDEIRYDDPVPERWLHFQCPDDAEIRPEGWGKIDDPNHGIGVAGLSEGQACTRILTDLFDAVNKADLSRIRRLIPFAAELDDPALAAAVYESLGGLWDDPTPGLAGYEIGTPYRDGACPLGVLVPCVLSDHQGRRFEVTFIVRFRSIDGRDSCVVVFTWGKARKIEG